MSVSTIDRIISGRGVVKETTIRHVLAVAERMGFYAVDTIRARIKATIEKRTFGFLLNSHARNLYRNVADEIAERASNARGINITAVVRHIDELDPQKIADTLRQLGKECDAIACLCIDHPEINAAIRDVAMSGIPVICIISDVSAPERAGFIGANDWQLGRTAGWFMQRLRPTGSKIAVMIGSERYLCQQAHETSFRSFIRASALDFTILDTLFTAESDAQAEAIACDLLDTHDDLAGIFLAGGGVDGVTRALSTRSRENVALIATELSEDARRFLTAGTVDLVLDHPVTEIAEEAVDVMLMLTTARPMKHRIQQIIPFRVVVSENL